MKLTLAITVAVAAVFLYLALMVYALVQATDALADPASPVIGTGGNTSGTDPGSGCVTRSSPKFTPTQTSSPFAWAEPDWPGFATVDTPTSGSGCSR